MLFLVLRLLTHRYHKLATPGFVAGAFVAGYGAARTFAEFFRQPDIQIGYLAGGLTMGMLLSVPMIAIGIATMVIVSRRPAPQRGGESMTPLAEKLVAQIRASGPITVADFMAACLADPEHGYYMRGEPFGRAGDFITAPEISQIFGELIGLWAIGVWEMMGSPNPFVLAELGPGRGTLMADMLRTGAGEASFLDAASVHLVEMSPRLATCRRRRSPPPAMRFTGTPASTTFRARRRSSSPTSSSTPCPCASSSGRTALGGARRRPRRGRPARLRPVAGRPSGRPSLDAARRRRGRSLADRQGGDDADRRAPCPRPRRGARHRLRQRKARHRRHAAGGAPAQVREPLRHARRGRPHRPCRFLRPRPHRRRRPASSRVR